MEEYLNNNEKIDIISTAAGYSKVFDSKKYSLSVPYLRSSLKMIANKNFDINDLDDKTLAINYDEYEYFKNVNDTYGHIVGNKVIKKVSSILKEKFSDSCILGRIGGNEFILFSKDIDLIENLESKLDDLKKDISEVNIERCKISLSIGVIISNTGATYEKLFVAADKNLYKVKKSGRANYNISFIN